MSVSFLFGFTMNDQIMVLSKGGKKFIIVEHTQYNHLSVSPNKGTITWQCYQNQCYVKIYTKGDTVINIKGTHNVLSHEHWDEERITKHILEQEVIQKIKETNLAPHKAYNSVARDHPNHINVFSGYRDMKNKAYRARGKTGFILPKKPTDISSTLRDNGLDTNYYGQKIKLKRYDDNNVSDEIMNEWKSKICIMYLGDGETGEIQVFCCKNGALLLRAANNIHFDVSFKCTPKISPSADNPIPYKGCLHLIVTFDPKNNEESPMAIPCATILYKNEKPDAETYDFGIKYLRKRCVEVHDIDIINETKTVKGMGDYEIALKIAISKNWTNIIIKGCLFHYSQCLNRNIGYKGLRSVYQQNGKHFDYKFYCYIRKFHSLALLPPKLVPKAWNILAGSYTKYVPQNYKEACKQWILYHKRFWMKSATFILEWNCYRSLIRTNNSLETRNNLINIDFGTHPYLFDFVWSLAQWFADGFIQYDQYIIHQKGNKKKLREILKEKVLLDCWNFIDKNHSNEDILLFLNEASKSMKADTKTLKKMLLRDVLRL